MPSMLCVVIAYIVSVSSVMADGPLRVLFVGNSYTYENNLPDIFRQIAGEQSIKEVAMVAVGGATLERHLASGHAEERLSEGGWDVVVLQEQSVLGFPRFVDGRLLLDSPERFYEASRRLVDIARDAAARVVFYATWPTLAEPGHLEPLHNAYSPIASELGADLAPVGLVWREHAFEHPAPALYGPDGAHPSPIGTYLAAATIARTVLGHTPSLESVHGVVAYNGMAQPTEDRFEVRVTQASADRMCDAIEAANRAVEASPLIEIDTPPITFPEAPQQGDDLTHAALAGTWAGSMFACGEHQRTAVTVAFRSNDLERGATITLRTRPMHGFFDDVDIPLEVTIEENGVLSLACDPDGFGMPFRAWLAMQDGRLEGVVRIGEEPFERWITSTIALERGGND